MYKYFMGRQSNLKNRTSDVPIVIATDSKTSSFIDSWLDGYKVDFDKFIDCIKLVIKIDICRINLADYNCLVLYLEDGKIAFLDVYNEDEPRCTLHFNDSDEFELNLNGDIVVEEIFEETKNMRFGAKYLEFTQELFASKNKSVIRLSCDSNNCSLYEMIKQNIENLDNWESICEVINFVHSLDKTLSTFTISLASYDDEFQLVNLDVEDGTVTKYIVSNDSEFYEVESDGGWRAKIDDILVKFDIESKTSCVFVTPKSIPKLKESFSQIMISILEKVSSMFEIIRYLDSTIADIAVIEKPE